MPKNKPGSVVQIRLTARVAQQRVADLASDSRNLRWTRHIRERMKERGIDSEDVLRILRGGLVEHEPVAGEGEKEWKIKLTRKMATGRVAGVVTLLIADSYLRLLTAEWEDFR